MMKWFKQYVFECIIGLLILAILIVKPALSDIEQPDKVSNKTDCVQKWDKQGKETSYTNNEVCLVQIKPDVWVPESSVKITD